MIIILGLLAYSLNLVFGVILSLSFAGIEKAEKHSKSKYTTVIYLLITAIVQFIFWLLWGFEITSKLYPIITHIPLMLLITIYYKRPWKISLVSVLTAYLCCQTTHWFGELAQYIFSSHVAYYITNIIVIFPVLFFLVKYTAHSVYLLIAGSKKSLLLFGIVPLMFYLFDYATTVYTDILYSGISAVVEFLPSIVSMFYFLFIMLFYSEQQRHNKIENENMLLTIQANQSKKELASLQKMQEQAVYYRHDLRHHISLIKGYLAIGDLDKIEKYLSEVEADIDSITPTRFCQNETVNLIISALNTKAIHNNVVLIADINLPEEIAIRDTDICTVLSNGIENAIKATSAISDNELKKVKIKCKINKNKLLIYIENPYSREIILQNGYPKSNEEGHGYGIKSIESVAEKYHGYSTFETKDNAFILRVVLNLC